jgi:hypothetical protein
LRLQEPNRDALVLYACSSATMADYVLNQPIATTIARTVSSRRGGDSPTAQLTEAASPKPNGRGFWRHGPAQAEAAR